MNRLFFVVLGLLCLVGSKGFASTPDLYGMSSRAAATAGLTAFSRPDPSFAYQNPALMSHATRSRAHLGFMSAVDFFKPIQGVTTRSGKRGDVITDYPNLSGLSAGLIVPVKKFLPRLTFGTAGFFPFGSLAKMETFENTEPVYANYYNRPKRFAWIAGLSFKPLDHLYLGAAANLYLTSGANTRVNLNTENSSVVVAMDIKPAISPIFGLQYEKRDWSFEAAYHGAVDYALSLQNESDVSIGRANSKDIAVPVHFLAKSSMFYDPQMVSLGVSHLIDHWFQVGMEATWKNWKAYKLPVNRITYVNIGDYKARIPDIQFRDVWSPAVGIEFPVRPLMARAGYRYEPQHLDAQEDNSNWLDTDVHIVSTGLGYAFGAFDIDLHVQWHQLTAKTISKSDPTAMGYKEGGYDMGGSLLNYGLTLSTTF